MRTAVSAAAILVLACATVFPCLAQDTGSPDQGGQTQGTSSQANDQPAANQNQSAQADSQSSQAASAASAFAPSFSAGVSLGSDVLLTGSNGSQQTWTKLGFEPDIAIGKIGIGLDLDIHFLLYQTSDQAVTIYGGDWIPNYNGNGKSFFDIYLPKLAYVRYGLKGSDPLFVKLGSIDDLSLGDGFIMANYSNKLFLPGLRIFGLDAGLDGSMFGFPYVGIEALTGNLARLDVVGARIYARPLAGTDLPILKVSQIGFTAVADTNPYLYSTETGASTIAAYGVDIQAPIVQSGLFPLSAYTDLAVDPNKSLGWMIGAGGKLIGIFTYGAQLRVLQNGFLPTYFDANYDVFRDLRYDQMQAAAGSGVTPSWLASIGASVLGDKFGMNISLDGPFSMGPQIGETALQNGSGTQSSYPHLRGLIQLAQMDSIPVYFTASYDKYYLGAVKGFFPDLIDPTDAVAALAINYKTGATVLTLTYNANWNPATAQFDVSSSLQATVKF